MPKPHTIRAPFTDNAAADIDDMFRSLYRMVEAIQTDSVGTDVTMTLVQGEIVKIGTAPVGILTVVNITDSEVMQFEVLGTGTVVDASGQGNFSATKGTAGTLNAYYEADGVYLQNNIAGTKTIWFRLTGV